MTSMSHRPAVARAGRRLLRRSFGDAALDPGSAYFRLWWMQWNGFLHGLYLLLGASWCLVHWPSFAVALPPIAPAWALRVLAVALGGLGTWLLIGTFGGHVRRRARRWAAAVSTVLAIICFGAFLLGSERGLYLVAGAFHALFAAVWILLFVLRRPRARRHSHMYP
jgi:hypothetical protein